MLVQRTFQALWKECVYVADKKGGMQSFKKVGGGTGQWDGVRGTQGQMATGLTHITVHAGESGFQSNHWWADTEEWYYHIYNFENTP